MALLELQAIIKEFPGVRALDGVSLTLEKGEIHALCGENGAGKSTLIKILGGYYPAGTYRGEVWLHGQSVHFKSPKAAAEHGIAVIAQELALVPEMSVLENLLLGREPAHAGFIAWGEARRNAQQALELVGLEVPLALPVKELGIGQQQMIEIAKALSKRAEILVLDEPTAALTESATARLMELLRQLRAQGVSCLYISHRLEEVFALADRLTVLRDGRSVASQPIAQWSQAQVIMAMVGREVKNLYPRPTSPLGSPLLRVKNLCLRDPANPQREVVHEVSLTVRQGEVVGLAGLMGAGRTALLSALFGVARAPVSGTVAVEDREYPGFANPSQAMAAGLALLSEDRKRYGLVLESAVSDNLTLAILQTLTHHGFLDANRLIEQCQSQVQSLRIKTPGLATWVKTLSGGNQQKVVLGKWLLAKPKVLLLDEPTRGIDVGAKAEIYELLGRLAAQGLGILLVSSDLPELLGLSHRLIVLNQGRHVAEFDASAATPETVMTAAAGVQRTAS